MIAWDNGTGLLVSLHVPGMTEPEFFCYMWEVSILCLGLQVRGSYLSKGVSCISPPQFVVCCQYFYKPTVFMRTLL